jgi:hypothetical protein
MTRFLDQPGGVFERLREFVDHQDREVCLMWESCRHVV